jgi:hypothetical protein
LNNEFAAGTIAATNSSIAADNCDAFVCSVSTMGETTLESRDTALILQECLLLTKNSGLLLEQKELSSDRVVKHFSLQAWLIPM